MINQEAPATRVRLVRAAMQLFAEKGYGSTSIADILRVAGVNSGSLYYFFPGKQDLLIAVLTEYRDAIGPMLIEPAWRGIDDPIERIFALLDRYRVGLVESECTYGCPIGSLALELHEPDPPVRELLAANFNAWVDAIEQCIKKAAPRLAPDKSSRDLAEFVLTTMEGAVMQSRAQRDIAFFDRSVRQLRRYFSCLTKPPPAPASRARVRKRR
jgi:TetR/AcrR family transcriptional repressor of nem operon